jgi:lysozyme
MEAAMQIDEKGLALIKHFEGLFLKAYVDPVGVVTIGYGHTKTAKLGMIISEQKAEELLRNDLSTHENFVNNIVEVKLNGDQYSALVSFAFNVGNGALKTSSLLNYINNGKYKKASAELEKWVYGTVGGKKIELPGLVRRRRSERLLFEEGILDFGFGPIEVAQSEKNTTSGSITHSGSVVSHSATDDGLDAEFSNLFNEWGIKNFKAYELLVRGSKHSQQSSPAYGLNTIAPRDMWNNIRPTILVLDRLRDKIGSPIQTLSVYRNLAYNTAIGGATKSMHMQFNAIDFQVKNTTLHPSQWAGLLQEMKANGEFDGWIGIYPSFIHVDTRNNI